LFFLVPLLLWIITSQLLWAKNLGEWVNRRNLLVALWGMSLTAIGVAFSPLLVSNLQLGMAYVLGAIAPLLVGVWLWVPFISKSKAERIALKFMRNQLGDKKWTYITSTELKGQRWDVCGYWIDPATPNTRRHFWVKIHSKCGNVTAC